jgi:peptidoglycan hydrolase-like protein with peptidoglycan-binding domain
LLSVGRLRSRVMILAVVILALLSTGTWFALSHAQAGQSGRLTAAAGRARQASRSAPVRSSAPPLQVLSVTPARRARHVDGTAPVRIRFSAALAADSPMPTVSPHIAGRWQRSGASTVEFVPKQGFAQQAHVTVQVPGGVSGMRSASGGTLARRMVVRFSVGRWSATRLDQLLAQLGYLPLTWTPATGAVSPAADDAAGQRSAAFSPPAGIFTWQQGYPRELRTFWRQGQPSLMLRGAVIAFESDHGLTMDGIAGSGVWRTLLRAVAAGQRSAHGYTYARATKKSPETLTIWHNGHVVFRSLANTGIPVAPTADGTAPVYLRYRFQIMKGTNPDGTKYADPVQFVAYFRAGEAVHYFPRPSYGFPQSLGCVELPLAAAARAWPFLTYGSLVTVSPPPA